MLFYHNFITKSSLFTTFIDFINRTTIKTKSNSKNILNPILFPPFSVEILRFGVIKFDCIARNSFWKGYHSEILTGGYAADKRYSRADHIKVARLADADVVKDKSVGHIGAFGIGRVGCG
mgnify:CR=1 FL=1